MWKAVNGTDGMIEVNERGEVRSLLRGTPRMLKTQPDAKGYLRLRVTINRVKMGFKVHREVAKAFIPNPLKLPQVNHKDGNKGNNCVSNLEWVSNKQNAAHAIRTGLWDSVIEGAKRENESRKKPVIGYCGGEVRRFESVSEAERFVESRHVCDVLKGKREHVKGWSFEYVKGGEECETRVTNA
ncbi:MAG: hypothetical protein E7287_05080 [Lachnospiraceae bacterium]|nr:hypothetical protein [Lachnospiraceae bacterium]